MRLKNRIAGGFMPLVFLVSLLIVLLLNTTAVELHLELNRRTMIEIAKPNLQELTSTSSPPPSTLLSLTPSPLLTECGNTDDLMENCFKQLPSHFIEFLHSTEFPADKHGITLKCTVFYSVMSCFEEYTARCLSTSSKVIVDNTVANTKTFFHHICNNSTFQNDFLQHKECFGYIEDDWERCTDKLKENILQAFLAQNNNNLTEKFMRLCCAGKEYEECINKSAVHKCNADSANYVLKIVKLSLEDKQYKNCQQYDEEVCFNFGSRSTSAAMDNSFGIINVVRVYCVLLSGLAVVVLLLSLLYFLWQFE